MRFVTVREFRGNTASVRKRLETEREIVLTSNGKPFAMLTPLEPDTVEEELAAVRQARARVAIDRMRDSARQAGLDKMPMDEVIKLVAKARRNRRSRR